MSETQIKKFSVVAAVITDDSGRMLVTQRGTGMRFTGKWEFPGGKVEEGESLESALKREILEELMLKIDIKEQILKWQYSYPFAIIDFTAYRATVSSGELKLVEHMSSKWVRPGSELSRLDWVPADLKLVAFLNN